MQSLSLSNRGKSDVPGSGSPGLSWFPSPLAQDRGSLQVRIASLPVVPMEPPQHTAVVPKDEPPFSPDVEKAYTQALGNECNAFYLCKLPHLQSSPIDVVSLALNTSLWGRCFTRFENEANKAKRG